MLWELEITPAAGQPDREAERIRHEAVTLGIDGLETVASAKSYLIEGRVSEGEVRGALASLLVDPVVEKWELRQVGSAVRTGRATGDQLQHGVGESTDAKRTARGADPTELNVLFKPGVTDNVAKSALNCIRHQHDDVEAVATVRKYRVTGSAEAIDRLGKRVLANDSIEVIHDGPLALDTIGLGGSYTFEKTVVPIRSMSDDELVKTSQEGLLSLKLVEMQTVRDYFVKLDRDPSDVELETIAQTWSEHCSHKTLAGRIDYKDEVDPDKSRVFGNMLKETVFAATMTIKESLGAGDWTVSVFKDNAGVVTFTDTHDICIKVETHNHPSALEPYGGANTGLGGVIRDPLGTGLGAKPVCNTDVFCFASPDTPADSLPPGVLHPRAVMHGVVAGVRDYGNRMGIPTVNGAVFFDDRYLGNPLVYCGNVAVLPVGMSEASAVPGDYIVAVGGRTGRDGIHGATFSSIELDEHSETTSGGAVQIGNAIEEKKVADAILRCRDEGLYSAITDCGAGGFSSAVGEMGEKTGAEVWLDKCPLKYSGLSYTEIWISEAQERMVLSVPASSWARFQEICHSEDVEATAIGKFTDTKQLVLQYDGNEVARIDMEFLHDGRPPVVREAVYRGSAEETRSKKQEASGSSLTPTETLKAILAAPNVRSKEWIIRQYDHEVQAGSVVKPLVGVDGDGPSDAAVVKPLLDSDRGVVISCGMNPHLGDSDPYWMAASAIDEAVRNAVAVGADPAKIAILDNFCWGNTDKPEVLGSLVRCSLGLQDTAIAYGTPFVSGKDSLYNEFSYIDENGEKQTVAIPASMLVTAMGQIDDVKNAVTMDLKRAGSTLYLIGETAEDLGGSHYSLVRGETGGNVPKVDIANAPKVFAALHKAISQKLVLACHDVSEGGVAAAVAEMAFAGGFGVTVDVPSATEAWWFSESPTRFVVEVASENAAAFEAAMAGAATTSLGSTNESATVLLKSNGQSVIEAANTELKAAWQTPLV